MDFYRPPTTQETLTALGTIYRAVRALRFYPKGHPTRRSSLSLAHSAMVQLLEGNSLSLVCGRTGFSYPDGEVLKDSTGQTTSLAYELFVRRASKITFSHDLSQEDLLELLKLLCLPPETVQQSGGIDILIAERGIRTICVNEFDIAAISIKRRKIEESGVEAPGIDEVEAGDDAPPPAEQQPPEPEVPPQKQQLEALIVRIKTEADADRYLILIRQAVACADTLLSLHEPHMVFPLLELLAEHAGDKARNETMRESAHFAIEQIASTGDAVQASLTLAEQGRGLSNKTLQTVLRAGGPVAITSAIEYIGRTSSIKFRKTLTTILGSLGEAALPVLLDLMNDPRWFVTRNICTILASISSAEALPALARCLRHPELRVRKEAIRSLAQLGGIEAETAIIGVLRGSDTALYPQAVVSLGGLKSRRSLPELLKIVLSRDLFLQSLPLKIDALSAIALIGDLQVTPHLVAIFEERFLLAASRGKQLKIAVAACLGRLGDTRAVPSLEKQASNKDELGSACSDAVSLIVRIEGKSDGIS